MSSVLFTFRTYLMIRAMELTQCTWMEAIEAVASTALEHPEWEIDRTERHTYEVWRDREQRGVWR